MSSKSGSGSKRKVGDLGSSKREGRKEKSRAGSGRESRGEGSIDRPSVFSRLGTKMSGGAGARGSASTSSGAPAWSNRGSLSSRQKFCTIGLEGAISVFVSSKGGV